MDNEYDSLFDSEIIVEWVNGERIPLREYDERLQEQFSHFASAYLLKINRDCHWIFGIP